MHPIRALSLYEFLATLGIGLTVATGSLLQLQVGMTIADIAFVNIVFWAVIILAELPTGMLADVTPDRIRPTRSQLSVGARAIST